MREKKFLARKYQRKKIFDTVKWLVFLEKKSYTLVCCGKKFYHQRFGGKKVLPNPDHPYHPRSLPHLKSQMVGPLPTTSTEFKLVLNIGMDCPRVAVANLVSQSYWENFTQQHSDGNWNDLKNENFIK